MAAAGPVDDREIVSPDVVLDFESDYGTDIDEHDISELLLKANSQPLDDIVLTELEQDPVTEHAVVHLRSSGQEAPYATIDGKPSSQTITIATEVEYSSLPPIRADSTQQKSNAEPESVANDGRSPLERFRMHPKKPLSVTDIVSPAWCEQQYLYSLSKYGRVRRTPAMKQGTKVHKVLEEQVHTTVRIEVKSREDMFGLKLWNVIQGLRTLRATGITREMEVWGLLDGQVVNGIIDEVTTTCPDEALEARLLQQHRGHQTKETKLEANQTTLTDRFSASQERSTPTPSTVYLVDVKTRQSRTLPANDGRLRPTQMQLMLYHRLLSSLASDNVDKDAIFRRYNLDGAAVFSDTFIAEVSKLDHEAYLGTDDNYSNRATNDLRQDSVAELLANNTLSALWTYMAAEFSKTLPGSCLSPVLAAEFRTANDGALLGKRSFEFDAARLEAYVTDELNWWKGVRPTKGVDIEEAFKCRICQFAEECSWRKDQVEAAVQKSRQHRTKSQQLANG